jgi:hypothetical protein
MLQNRQTSGVLNLPGCGCCGGEPPEPPGPEEDEFIALQKAFFVLPTFEGLNSQVQLYGYTHGDIDGPIQTSSGTLTPFFIVCKASDSLSTFPSLTAQVRRYTYSNYNAAMGTMTTSTFNNTNISNILFTPTLISGYYRSQHLAIFSDGWDYRNTSTGYTGSYYGADSLGISFQGYSPLAVLDTRAYFRKPRGFFYQGINELFWFAPNVFMSSVSANLNQAVAFRMLDNGTVLLNEFTVLPIDYSPTAPSNNHLSIRMDLTNIPTNYGRYLVELSFKGTGATGVTYDVISTIIGAGPIASTQPTFV